MVICPYASELEDVVLETGVKGTVYVWKDSDEVVIEKDGGRQMLRKRAQRTKARES